ncbi:MAG: hypothetical protein OXG43_11665 [Chloroflexi bacterium]|nr:hypothetical protein [Chloroflexota bacterium]
MSTLSAAWTGSLGYTRRGLRVLGATPWLYVQILSAFAAPAAIAAYVTASDIPEGFGRSALLYVLNAVSASAAPVVVMTAVAAGFHGVNLGFVNSMRHGLWWLLRYLWTNVHTTVIFWAPILVLLNLFEWQRREAPVDGGAGLALTAAWVVLIGVAALYIHSRTLLAPFFAVHGNLPATLATIESWRMSGRRFPIVFGTFIVASAPTAVPLAIVLTTLAFTLDEADGSRAVFKAMLPSLVWVVIKIVRPFLIAATYGLYTDLWTDEQRRRAEHGTPAVPLLARPLLAFSRWVPRLFGRAIGRRIEWTA